MCALLALTVSTTACVTGPRPTLGPETTLAPVTDAAILGVIDALSAEPASAFSVTYDVTTKYGGITSTAEVTFDPERGTAVLIDEVLYVFSANGSALTCSWSEESLSAENCSAGTDESRVSDLQLNSRVFNSAAIDRLARDAQVAARPSVSRETTTAERTSTCVDVPVVDSTGTERMKSYCAFPDLGVIASLDTGDLTINAVFVDDVATTTLFDASSGNE